MADSNLQLKSAVHAVPPRTGVAKARYAVATMLAGLAIVAGATAFAAASVAQPGGLHRSSPGAGAEAAPIGADVSVTELTYPSGHSSGWHAHPGVHSIVVLSGTLTMYDEACGRQEYGAGDSYLGGSRAHLARNEAPEELRVIVTSVYSRASAGEQAPPGAGPAGCEAR